MYYILNSCIQATHWIDLTGLWKSILLSLCVGGGGFDWIVDWVGNILEPTFYPLQLWAEQLTSKPNDLSGVGIFNGANKAMGNLRYVLRFFAIMKAGTEWRLPKWGKEWGICCVVPNKSIVHTMGSDDWRQKTVASLEIHLTVWLKREPLTESSPEVFFFLASSLLPLYSASPCTHTSGQISFSQYFPCHANPCCDITSGSVSSAHQNRSHSWCGIWSAQKRGLQIRPSTAMSTQEARHNSCSWSRCYLIQYLCRYYMAIAKELGVHLPQYKRW